MENRGSFGAAIGGDPLQAAMAARSTGQAGATQQVSPAAATFDPATQLPQGSPQPTGAMPQPEMPFQSPESTMIIKALDSRLKALSKQEELKANGGIPKF